MFTGLIETQGTIAAVTGPGASDSGCQADADAGAKAHSGRDKDIQTSPGPPRRITVATGLGGTARQPQEPPMRLGDSVAVDGCCLTVVAFDAEHLSFEAATETLARTTLGALEVGDLVNLERALRFGDRLGGHLVTGHVDGVGHLCVRQQRGSAVYFDIEAPPAVGRLTAARGSITVAGVSLTVTQVTGHVFSVGLIPHTLAHTTLGTLQPGAAVNLEADLLARYVERLLEHRADASLTRPCHSPMPVASHF